MTDRTPPAPAREMLLLRTHFHNETVSGFADRLAAQSGRDFAWLADETQGSLACGPLAKVSITREACGAEGLHCPDDFTWRCGDYGLYLARKAFPDRTHFWVVEHDVRIMFSRLRDFFAIFAPHPEVDLVAPRFGVRDASWHWTASMRQTHETVYGCLFPLVRISARAIDHLLARRRAWRLRGSSDEWPNDEAFAATELMQGGYVCREMNGFGVSLHNERGFSFDRLISGPKLERRPPDGQIYHPVLYGAALARRSREIEHRLRPGDRLRRRVAGLVRAAGGTRFMPADIGG